MRIHIKAVHIIDPHSKWHQQIVDLLVINGVISAINPAGEIKADQTISGQGLYASTSWFDMRVFSGEPGEEYREDFESLSQVLEAGGFGGALMMPNTIPVIQNKSDVISILTKNTKTTTQILPAVAVTLHCIGESLNEMMDAHYAGTVAFTDGSEPIWNSDILVKSLQYLQKFDGLLINFPQDQKLAMFGQMNEGIVSTGLGLKGIPHLAEEIIIQRDIALLRYAGGKIHFSCLSSAKSVDLIRKAKAEGLKVSCDVGIHHLILDDTNLETFDTHYKVSPPFRTQKDIEGLIAGVNDGTIDVIVSSHQAYDEDHKKMEFDLANFGIMGAQIVFPLYQKFLKDKIELNTFVNCISTHPKKILKLESKPIELNEIADFTVFSTHDEWLFNADTNCSKSSNSPFLDAAFSAKAVAVFKNHKYAINPKHLSA